MYDIVSQYYRQRDARGGVAPPGTKHAPPSCGQDGAMCEKQVIALRDRRETVDIVDPSRNRGIQELVSEYNPVVHF